MADRATMRPPGSYGFDAPRLLIVPVLLIVAGVVQGAWSHRVWPIVGAALVIGCCGLGYYASRRGKFVVWSRLLDDQHLTGAEQVLDLGCGRGAVLILAARHLSTGRATGVDLWRADQSGNSADATRRNATAAGVADRVELHTADIAELPFPDGSFDLVVSSLVVHNLSTAAARGRAIDEAVRVLRPGGRLMIADLRATGAYERHLRTLGLAGVGRRSLGWRLWWTGPWLPTHLVTATKPVSPGPAGAKVRHPPPG
jgi:arsenite methyltransferase